MPLVLRRARDGRASAGTPDDYDVLDDTRAVGRIFHSNSADRSTVDVDHHGRGSCAAAAVARVLRNTRRREGGICHDLARMAAAYRRDVCRQS
jgi:hypothetical protein